MYGLIYVLVAIAFVNGPLPISNFCLDLIKHCSYFQGIVLDLTKCAVQNLYRFQFIYPL